MMLAAVCCVVSAFAIGFVVGALRERIAILNLGRA